MNELELLGEVREKIGNVGVNQVSDRRLRDSYVIPALMWLAGKLAFNVRTEDRAIGLVASQIEYPLTSDVLSVIWVEWNNRRLEPVSLTISDRDQTNWRDRDPGEPAQWAIQGRKLALIPPPTAAAITTDAYLSLRYIATPGPLGPDGPQGLSDLDQWLVIHEAARMWCETNYTEENERRMIAYEKRVAMDLMDAKARWINQSDLHEPEFRLETSHKRSTAR